MVVYYDLESREIVFTENGTNKPLLIRGSEDEIKSLLSEQNLGFIVVDQEIGEEIFDYALDEEFNLKKCEVIK